MNSRECRWALLLEPYVDSELPEPLGLCVEAHLHDCKQCAKTVHQLETIGSTLTAWPALAPEDREQLEDHKRLLAARLLSTLKAVEPGTSTPVRRARERRLGSSIRVAALDGVRAATRGAGVMVVAGGKAGMYLARRWSSHMRTQAQTRKEQPPVMMSKARARSGLVRTSMSLLGRSASVIRSFGERGALALG